MQEETNKQKITNLVNVLRERSGLIVVQIVERMNSDEDFGILGGYTRAEFENKFIQKPLASTQYTDAELYALIAAFTRHLPHKTRCTAQEAVNLCAWAKVIWDHEKLGTLLGAVEVKTAIDEFLYPSFVPKRKKWTRTGNMADARNLHSACVLADNKVLVVGGCNPERSGEANPSAEIYQPERGTWSNVGHLNMPRYWCGMVRLTTGQVLVAGGTDDAQGEGFASAELYDLRTGKWSLTGSMAMPRRLPVCVRLDDGRVLIAGGAHGIPDNNRYISSAEIYNSSTEEWSMTSDMNFARDNAKGVLLPDGRVLVVGGEDKDSFISEVEIYDPETEEWSLCGQLTLGRSNSSVTCLSDGRVVIAGGATGLDNIYDTVDIFDPETGECALAEPMLHKRTGHTATLLSNDRILVTGGMNRMGLLRSCEIYDPTTNTWTADVELEVERVGHLAVMLRNTNILIVGGLTKNAADSASCEVYSF